MIISNSTNFHHNARESTAGIYGFIHVALYNNNTDKILSEQIDRLHNSGLMNNTKKIFVGIVGEEDADALIDMSKFFVFKDLGKTKGELFTLWHLKEFCNYVPDSKIWYIHTKGVSINEGVKFDNAQCWRKYMEYFIIDKYKDCIDSLENFDACGVEWQLENAEKFTKIWGRKAKAAFSGNFWWATSNYIKNLPENVIDFSNGYDRHDAEYKFIGINNPKVKCFHNSYINLYDNCYSSENYNVKT